ncbi:MAG: hypothetical protein KKD18_05525 [Nanoarchaeota archaeon]|nr:hypothetical protein [Nanoarchaeota archaeon]MBU0977851.1 hypothetical protein [Nanoarchaeota archaeon]
MVAITGTNSLGSLIGIVGVLWYLISAWLLRRHYVQTYAKSIKSRIAGIFVVGKLLFVNDIKNDSKLNTLIWHTRISILVFIIGIILILI